MKFTGLTVDFMMQNDYTRHRYPSCMVMIRIGMHGQLSTHMYIFVGTANGYLHVHVFCIFQIVHNLTHCRICTRCYEFLPHRNNGR